MKSFFLKLIFLFCFGIGIQAQKQITTPQELAAINADANSLKAHYILMNDITLENWIPIGDIENPFVGIFDGNQRTITIKSIVGITQNAFALKSKIDFPFLNTCCIGLFGSVGKRGKIKNLRIDGEIDFENEQSRNIIAGGVVGINYGSIYNCVSEISIKIKDLQNLETKSDYVSGGFAGINNGAIRNCYSTGNISAEGGRSNYSGGIVGFNDFDGGILQWCFAKGDISALEGIAGCYAGAIAGFSTEGGLIQYCVGLNKNITTADSDKCYTGRIVAKNQGRFGNNFDRNDMKLTFDEAKPNNRDLIDYSTLQNIEWWTVNRHIRFSFGNNESKPWAWSTDYNHPVMHWDPKASTESRKQITEKTASEITEIRNGEELATLGNDAIKRKSNYILMNNVEVENWRPIGNAINSFNGTFDGNGYTITIKNINKEIASTSRPYKHSFQGGNITHAITQSFFVGIFGVTGEKSVIKNLGVVGDISFDSGKKDNVIGGIVGENYGKIDNCRSSVNIIGSGGFYNKKLKVWTSYSGGCYIGGITGINKGSIRNCYSTGDLSVSSDAVKCVGGIAGSNGFVYPSLSYENGYIKNCYSSSNITSNDGKGFITIGGIVGVFAIGTISECVALNEKITIEGEIKQKGLLKDYISNLYGSTDKRVTFKIESSFARSDMIFNTSSEITCNSFLVDYNETLNKSWWVNSSKNFVYLFGEKETVPWAWDEGLKRPILYWETNTFTQK